MKHLRIHAIILALNEEVFIENQLKTLYPYCSGISVLTQYDRNWYGEKVVPDSTVEIVIKFPDPEGKIQLVVRRWRDQAAALNSEMQALSNNPAKKIISHGSSLEEINKLHSPPNYFLIVDADELFDIASFPNILNYLTQKKPKAMKIFGFNYKKSWNYRVPMNAIEFCQFGFVKPGFHIESIRNNFTLTRVEKVLDLAHFKKKYAQWLTRIIICPPEIGYFHHGCWLGSNERLIDKATKSAHRIELGNKKHIETINNSVDQIPTEYVPTELLPENIRNAVWPKGYID